MDIDSFTFTDIDNLSPRDFEFYVRDLLVASGWTDTHVTEVGSEYRYGDGGVDIFAYRSGRRFAIEVKQRAITTNVSVDSLNQLVTGAALAKVQNKILVTNSYFSAEVKVRALQLGVELIDREELKNMATRKHSEIGRAIKPRKYQKEVIDEVIRKHYEGALRVLIEMATGLGKTYTVALLVKELMHISGKRLRVLFLAHQIEILIQSVTAFKNVMGMGSYSFSACFDGTYPENTDFVFASFVTLFNHMDELERDTFDIVIVDEAHHTPANTYAQVVEHFNPQLLIGMTATAFRHDNKNVLRFFGGKQGHVGKFDLVWALKHRHLAYPKYWVMLDDINQEKISEIKPGLSIADIDKTLFLHKKDEEVVRLIEHKVAEIGLTKVKGIVFCKSVAHMTHMLGFFKAGSALCVYSEMPSREVRENIRRFREGDVNYILVCNLFNEGIDIPEANLLVFLRYSGSRNIWLQQLGRGLRKAPGKDYVHVLDFVGNIERIQEINNLKTAISKQKVNKEHLETDERTSADIIHDSEFQVHYSESAARVLDLVEELRYRLNERGELIDQLQAYFAENRGLPSIEDLSRVLPDISPDQVATCFNSYHGFKQAALGLSVEENQAASAIRSYASQYVDKYGIYPSRRAVALQFTHAGLMEFTEAEIGLLLALPEEVSMSAEDEEEPDVPQPLPVAPPKPQVDQVDAVAQEKERILVAYGDVIKTRADIKRLPASEQNEIARVFKANAIFLNALRAYQRSE